MSLSPLPLPDAQRLLPASGERGRATSAPEALYRDVTAAWQVAGELALPPGALQREQAVFAEYERASSRDDHAPLTTVETPLGPLPLATAAGATAYRLAVTALRQGAAEVPDHLWELALRGLLDTCGALSARSSADAALVVCFGGSRWGTRSVGSDWRTMSLGVETTSAPEEGTLPTLTGTAREIVAMTADPKSAPAAFASGRIKVAQASGLIRLLGTLSDVPGLPGGGALRQVSRMLRLLRV